MFLPLTLSALTVQMQYCWQDCRHSGSPLPRPTNPKSWTTAVGDTAFNGSLLQLNQSSSFYFCQKNKNKKPACKAVLWRAKGAKWRLLALLRFPQSVSLLVSVSLPLSVLETVCNCQSTEPLYTSPQSQSAVYCPSFFQPSAKTSWNTRSKRTRWEERELLGWLHILLLWKTIQTLMFLPPTCCWMTHNKGGGSALWLATNN